MLILEESEWRTLSQSAICLEALIRSYLVDKAKKAKKQRKLNMASEKQKFVSVYNCRSVYISSTYEPEDKTTCM